MLSLTDYSDQRTLLYFQSGFDAQSVLVCLHAGMRAELHAPIVMSAGSDFGATVIAPRNRALAQIVASGAHDKQFY
jgi:hypothetical protein